MGVKRICPKCQKTFITIKNARIYCTPRCARSVQRKRNKVKRLHSCQWCAKKFQASKSGNKFCSCSCRGSFFRAKLALRRKTMKRRALLSASEIERRSREAGLSYGKYVAVKRIR